MFRVFYIINILYIIIVNYSTVIISLKIQIMLNILLFNYMDAMKMEIYHFYK